MHVLNPCRGVSALLYTGRIILSTFPFSNSVSFGACIWGDLQSTVFFMKNAFVSSLIYSFNLFVTEIATGRVIKMRLMVVAVVRSSYSWSLQSVTQSYISRSHVVLCSKRIEIDTSDDLLLLSLLQPGIVPTCLTHVSLILEAGRKRLGHFQYSRYEA